MPTPRTYFEEVLADSPEWALRCNETAGTTLADATGNGHTGTLSGPYSLNQPPMTAGLGRSIAFTGGHITVPFNSALVYSNDWALEMVTKFSGTGLGLLFGFFDAIAPHYPGPAVYINNGSSGLTVRDSTTEFLTLSDVIDGQYRHLFLGRRGERLEAWVNGTLVAQSGPISVYRPSAAHMCLMSYLDGSQSAVGSLDEVAYYKSMPSGDRIAVHAAKALDRRQLAGSAKLDTGAAANLVLIRRWDTHAHIAQVAPASNGDWQAYVDTGDFEVTTIGPTGYQPICHGPVTAAALD
jgi:hypothetical protein